MASGGFFGAGPWPRWLGTAGLKSETLESWLLFNGQHSKSLDDKDRIVIPAEFRKGLEAGGSPFLDEVGGSLDKAPFQAADGSKDVLVTITPGHGKCVSLYSADYFTRMFLVFKPQDCFTNPKIQAFARLVVGRSHRQSFDKQGRIHLPGHLREKCGIERGRDLVVVGVLDHVEVWDFEQWQKYNIEEEPGLNETTAHIQRWDAGEAK